MKIFLDDERDPAGPKAEWVIVRSFKEMVTTLASVILGGSLIEFISFDHDLGEELTGYDCLHLIIDVESSTRYKLLSDDFDYYVHSQNPVGRDRIDGLMKNYLKHRLTVEWI